MLTYLRTYLLRQSNYPPLKRSAICEAPSKPPILESHLSENDRKENIPNRRNIFIVKPIKCSIQEVIAESFAAQNLLTVDFVRTPQHYSARLSKQHELKSERYVNTSLPEHTSLNKPTSKRKLFKKKMHRKHLSLITL